MKNPWRKYIPTAGGTVPDGSHIPHTQQMICDVQELYKQVGESSLEQTYHKSTFTEKRDTLAWNVNCFATSTQHTFNFAAFPEPPEQNSPMFHHKKAAVVSNKNTNNCTNIFSSIDGSLGTNITHSNNTKNSATNFERSIIK